MIIYYNPACTKCNEAHEIIKSQHCEVEIRYYLTDPPTRDELKALLLKLGCKAFDLVRKSEPVFLEKFAGKVLSEMEWLSVLAEYPVLIERPIVIDGQKAVIGRPPALILDFIKDLKR